MPQRILSEVCVPVQKKMRRRIIFPRSSQWGTSRQQPEAVFYSSPALSAWSRCLSLDVLSSKYCLAFNQIFIFKKQALKQRIHINWKDTRHNPAHTEWMPEHAAITYVVNRYSSLHKRINIFSPGWLWQQCTVSKRGIWNQAKLPVSRNFISSPLKAVSGSEGRDGPFEQLTF